MWLKMFFGPTINLNFHDPPQKWLILPEMEYTFVSWKEKKGEMEKNCYLMLTIRPSHQMIKFKKNLTTCG